jgi:hypothetical protein
MARQGNDKGSHEDAAARRQQALDLRRAGVPYRAIGRQLNVSEAQAHRDVHAALARLAELELESANELRTMELLRLDALSLEASRILSATHPLVSGGKVLSRFTDDGKAIGLTDDGPKLAAIDRLLRISESRRRLLGLDAPTAVDVQGIISPAYVALRTTVLQMLPAEQRILLADALEQVIDAPIVDGSDDGA